MYNVATSGLVRRMKNTSLEFVSSLLVEVEQVQEIRVEPLGLAGNDFVEKKMVHTFQPNRSQR